MLARRKAGGNMPYGMYISAEGAQAQAKRMETISNNLATINTPGFKRDVATFQARLAEAVELGHLAPETGQVEDLGGGVMIDEVQTDFSPGKVMHTGIPTDMLINGGWGNRVDKAFRARGDSPTLAGLVCLLKTVARRDA